MSISALLIAGPTASGKSALALRLAEALDGEIINADSMQVYRDLRVLSARPSEGEMAQAPHHLFGHVDAAVNYSVGRWLEDAERALEAIAARGKMPIFVGGTGLYFKVLTQGLSAIPAVPEDVRARVRARAEGRPVSDLHAQLAQCDPEMAARLRPTDPQRILRALEVFAATGQSLATFQSARAAPLLDIAACAALFLAPERDILRAAIDSRFDAMLQHGALEEIAAIAARRLDPALPAMRAHGAPHLLAHVRGDLTVEEAAAQSKADTRAYAKRQFTFARRQLLEFCWVAPHNGFSAAMAMV